MAEAISIFEFILAVVFALSAIVGAFYFGRRFWRSVFRSMLGNGSDVDQ